MDLMEKSTFFIRIQETSETWTLFDLKYGVQGIFPYVWTVANFAQMVSSKSQVTTHQVLQLVMDVCFFASGETLAVLEPNEFKGRSGIALKQSLTTEISVSRFRQTLFLEDGSQIEYAEILKTAPAKVQLVVLDVCPPDSERLWRSYSKVTRPCDT